MCVCEQMSAVESSGLHFDSARVCGALVALTPWLLPQPSSLPLRAPLTLVFALVAYDLTF